jgi:hypothetical protein
LFWKQGGKGLRSLLAATRHMSTCILRSFKHNSLSGKSWMPCGMHWECAASRL